MKPTRDAYIPKGSRKVAHRHSSAVAYVYTDLAGRPCAAIFCGRQARPFAHHSYRSEERRAEHVAELFARIGANEGAKASWREAERAKRAKPSRLQVGHVLVATWGYDQTNVDFYQVTRVVTGRTVEIRPIRSRTVEETGWAQGRAIPDIDAFKGDAMRKRVAADDRIKLTSYASARLWDGRPVAWTAYA